MKILEEGPKENRVWYLTVHTVLTRGMFSYLIRKLPGVRITRKPKIFSFMREDVFLEFIYKDHEYYVEVEPFAKNHFEIHLKKSGCKPETSELKQELEKIRFPYFSNYN